MARVDRILEADPKAAANAKLEEALDQIGKLGTLVRKGGPLEKALAPIEENFKRELTKLNGLVRDLDTVVTDIKDDVETAATS